MGFKNLDRGGMEGRGGHILHWLLDSERSEEAIDFTKMFLFYFFCVYVTRSS